MAVEPTFITDATSFFLSEKYVYAFWSRRPETVISRGGKTWRKAYR